MSNPGAATWRCRASTDTGERCDFRGTHDDLREHAAEAGHPRCVVCTDALAGHERQTCERCADRVRDDLTAVETAWANLERSIGEAAYRGIAWTQLAMVNDGSTSGGGEDDHPRWHDPLPPAAVLDNLERDWREEFGHSRLQTWRNAGHPDRQAAAVVRDAIAYLRTWHTLAARTHPGFDDYAGELRVLRAQLEHAVGLADDPVVAPIWCSCADSGETSGRLVRWYAPPADAHPGLADEWTCCSCGESMDEAAYLLRLRVLTEIPGWVSIEAAARTVDRPQPTVWAWVQAGRVPVACSRFTQRMVVLLAAVQERSESVGRVATRSA
jgi:hypothetical protein